MFAPSVKKIKAKVNRLVKALVYLERENHTNADMYENLAAKMAKSPMMSRQDAYNARELANALGEVVNPSTIVQQDD